MASALTASLYLLPSLLVGTLLNLSVGIFVDRVPVRWLVTISSLLCAVAPLMMALVDPGWNYWLLEFWAQILSPMSGDVLFTVGLVIVSGSFPDKTQALAGAVFNTMAQFGMSLGTGICQVVALGVSGNEEGSHDDNEVSFEDTDLDALLTGYRASFWTMFALMSICVLIASVGLRKAGKVGLKRE
jgi:MFS family permease